MTKYICIDQKSSCYYDFTPSEAILYAVLFQAHLSTSSTSLIVKRSDLLKKVPMITDKEDTIYRLLNRLESKEAISILESNNGYDSIEIKANMWSIPNKMTPSDSSKDAEKSRLNLTELNEFNNLREQIGSSLVIDEWMIKDVIEEITIKFK